MSTAVSQEPRPAARFDEACASGDGQIPTEVRPPIAGSEADLPSAAPALHIVHVVLRLDVGGLERIVVDLARIGVSRGHRVTIICLERPGTLAPTAEAAGARVISLGKEPGRPSRLSRQIRDNIRELNPCILHTHQLGALWYVGRSQSGVPIVHSEHTDSIAIEKRFARKVRLHLLSILAARHARSYCCVSDSIANSTIRRLIASQTKVKLVHNGIDIDRYQGSRAQARAEIRRALNITCDALVVGTVGRLNEVKRQDLLLHSLAELQADLTNVHLLLVGDGPERARLENLARELGLSGRTHFVGYQSAPERYLPAMDVFALSSRLEGLPLSLLEAWAAGVPVVSTAVGGIPKVVQDGVSGLLVPSDDVTALSRSLRQVLTDTALAKRLCLAGNDIVRNQYSLDRMASAYEAEYRRLIVRESL